MVLSISITKIECNSLSKYHYFIRICKYVHNNNFMYKMLKNVYGFFHNNGLILFILFPGSFSRLSAPVFLFLHRFQTILRWF